MDTRVPDYNRLLVRKFPVWLKAGDKESLLRCFGAVDIAVMSQNGKMVGIPISMYQTDFIVVRARTSAEELRVCKFSYSARCPIGMHEIFPSCLNIVCFEVVKK